MVVGSVRRRRRALVWGALGLAAALTAACGARQGDGTDPTVGEGEPEIERIAAPPDAPTELPAHVLICGLHKNLELPLEVETYQSEDGLSLYDFAHDPEQLRTWLERYPGGRAWGLRQHPDDQGPGGTVGRQLSEPCFGNGAEAGDIIRQVVVVRAGGADASEALHNLVREGRSVHFVIERDGRVHQALDPVHAAVAPTEHANVAIYVALVVARRPPEWLPPVLLAPGASAGLAGALGAPVSAPAAAVSRSVAAPPDVFAERARCAIDGEAVLSEQASPEQELALATLLGALADEYPRIALEVPITRDGAMLRGFMADSLFHAGVLVDYHTRAETREPACLDLARILSLEE